MAHFFDPRTNQKTDFFALKACTTMRAALWNVGGPRLRVFSDNGRIAAVSTTVQKGGELSADPGIFNFFITGTMPGNILIRAENDAGDQWAFTQAVVSGSDLCLNAIGQSVQDLVAQLNSQNPTRLPRLAVSNRFDVFTKARVMEFQYLQGLTVDGAVGPKTMGKLGTRSTSGKAAPAGRCILVDLIQNRMFVYEDGVERMLIAPVHGGAVGHPSTPGVFRMTPRRLREHTSTTYPYPAGNMNFALFYHGVEAIHQGPGSLPSKGCIHVSPPFAERVFNWAGSSDIIVIVVKP